MGEYSDIEVLAAYKWVLDNLKLLIDAGLINLPDVSSTINPMEVVEAALKSEFVMIEREGDGEVEPGLLLGDYAGHDIHNTKGKILETLGKIITKRIFKDD